jgi:hypothetical protein
VIAGAGNRVVAGSPAEWGFPTAFVFESRSPDNLASSQGVTFTPDLSRFFATGGLAALNEGRSIYEYDSAYNQIGNSGPIGVAQGLPVGTSQINGIVYFEGKLYIGYNNYPTLPAFGGIIVVDPSNLGVIEALHPATNGHVEGCAIRNTGRGLEAFVFSHSSAMIERYDLATWEFQDAHDFGFWAVADAGVYYQGGGWYGDRLLLNLHGSQSHPKAIDACEWDDVALGFTPLYRMTRPATWCGQAFNFASVAQAFFAERQTDTEPDVYGIVEASVSSLATLPHQTPNPASGQLADLQYWYQRLSWNPATPAWELADTLGNAAPGIGIDGTHVYATPSVEGVQVRLDGETGSSVALGNLFGAGWPEATIFLRAKVRRNDANDVLFSYDASGSVIGDGVIEVNRTNARSVTFRYTTLVGGSITLTTDGDMFSLDQYITIACVLSLTGARIYVNGVLKKSNSVPGQIGGGGQACYLGSNSLGGAGAQFDCWDVRLYNAAKDPALFGDYNMWTD